MGCVHSYAYICKIRILHPLSNRGGHCVIRPAYSRVDVSVCVQIPNSLVTPSIDDDDAGSDADSDDDYEEDDGNGIAYMNMMVGSRLLDDAFK